MTQTNIYNFVKKYTKLPKYTKPFKFKKNDKSKSILRHNSRSNNLHGDED